MARKKATSVKSKKQRSAKTAYLLIALVIVVLIALLVAREMSGEATGRSACVRSCSQALQSCERGCGTNAYCRDNCVRDAQICSRNC